MRCPVNKEPCMYCKYNPITLVGKKLLNHGANIQYGKLRVYFENETLEMPINFCPVCGREIQPEDRVKRPHKEWEVPKNLEAFKAFFGGKFGV